MATYIVLGNLTDQGVRNIKQISQLTRQNIERASREGIKVVEVYTTMGAYDVVGIFEAPDDEAALKHVLQIGMQGNARTTTLRAFPRAEAEKVIQSLP